MHTAACSLLLRIKYQYSASMTQALSRSGQDTMDAAIAMQYGATDE